MSAYEPCTIFNGKVVAVTETTLFGCESTLFGLSSDLLLKHE